MLAKVGTGLLRRWAAGRLGRRYGFGLLLLAWGATWWRSRERIVPPLPVAVTAVASDTVELSLPGWVRAAMLSPDGETLALTVESWPPEHRLLPNEGYGTYAPASPYTMLAFWDTRRQRLRRAVALYGGLHGIRFAAGGRAFVAAAWDHSVPAKSGFGSQCFLGVWDTRTGACRRLPVAAEPWATAEAPDGTLAAVLWRDAAHFEVITWQPATGRRTQSVVPGGRGPVAFDPHGRVLAVPTPPGWSPAGVALYDSATGRRPCALAALPPFDYVSALAFSPNRELLAAIAFTEGRPFAADWELRTGSLLGWHLVPAGPVRDPFFAGDGKTLIAGAGVLSARRPAAGALYSPDLQWRQMLAPLPGATALAIGSSDTLPQERVELWDLRRARRLSAWDLPALRGSIECSGDLVAYQSGPDTVRLRRLAGLPGYR